MASEDLVESNEPEDEVLNELDLKAPKKNISNIREKWRSDHDVLFACISATASVGNVWRFPYLCLKNGGGAFLIVYCIAMVIFGLPMVYLELTAGQYLGCGGLSLPGTLCRVFKGVGIASMILVFFLNTYICTTIAWTCHYLFATLTALPGLPWDSCDNWWNTLDCHRAGYNLSSSSHQYWDYRVLQLNAGIDHGLGGFQFELAFFLLISWAMVWGIIYKGLHSRGKLLWCAAILPYTVLAVLLGRAVSLEGAWPGLVYYLDISWNKLLNPSTWADAFLQIIFTFKIGLGCLPAIGSYTKFSHNSLRDVLITCAVSTLTSILSGVLVFSLLGYLAQRLDIALWELASSGPGLVFITFPALVVSIPGAPLWAFLFFLMLLVIGVSSQFCAVEGLVTGIVDNWTDMLTPHRRMVTLLLCALMFLLGLPMCTHGGVYVFTLLDTYSCAGMSLLLVCLLQSVVLGWVCGAECSFSGVVLGSKLYDCISKMTGGRLNPYWVIIWKFVGPVIFIFLIIMQVDSHTKLQYGLNFYPGWADSLGFLLVIFTLLWIPAYPLYYVLRIMVCTDQPGTPMQKLRRGLATKTEGTQDFSETWELGEHI